MMLTLLTASLLSAASPEFSVVVARRLGVSPQVAAELAQQLATGLEGKKSPRLGKLLPLEELKARVTAAGLANPSTCNGASACVATIARVSGVTRLVALQIIKVGPNLALDLSVVDPVSSSSIASLTRTVSAKAAGEAVDALATELIAALPELAPPMVVAVPVTQPIAPAERTITAYPDAPVEPPPPEVVAKEEPPLRPPAPLHLAAFGVGDVVSRKIGIEIGASYAVASRVDVGLAVLIGQYPGFRITGAVHTLIDNGLFRPFAQARVTIHPVPDGVGVGGGLFLGATLELGPGRIVAGVLGELYAGPPRFNMWVVGPMLGYEVDFFRPDAPAAKVEPAS